MDTVFGLPTHALVVHAVVVLLPLAALGGIAIALVPALRRRFGWLVLAGTVVAFASVPVAVKSGESLYDAKMATFGPGDEREAALMERHQHLAEGLLPWAIVLLVGVLAVMAVHVRASRTSRTEKTAVPAGASAAPAPPVGAARGAVAAGTALYAVAALITAVGGVATLVQVMRIGHAGSAAVWSSLTAS